MWQFGADALQNECRRRAIAEHSAAIPRARAPGLQDFRGFAAPPVYICEHFERNGGAAPPTFRAAWCGEVAQTTPR